MLLSILLILVSSLFLVFSFPPIEIHWLTWISFIPFFFALHGIKEKRKVFLLSYVWGLVFWIGTIYWISNVTVAGFIFLILYLSLYLAIFGLFTCYLLPVTCYPLSSLLVIPSLWVVLEYLRSFAFTGFGWALLGYSQYKNLPLIQIADITGAYGVSFLIIFVNVSIFYIIKSILKRKFFYLLPVTCYLLLLIVSVLFYGYWRLSQDISGKRLKTSIIQGNFPALEKWTSGMEEKIIQKYLNLTTKASKDNPDLIIWPETAVPDYLNHNKKMSYLISETSHNLNIPLLVGTPWKENSNYYNSAVLFSDEGKIVKRYNKIHLVPFGEYFPFSKYCPSVYNIFESGNFSPGQNFTVFDLAKTLNFQYLKPQTLPAGRHGANRTPKFSVLICYEDIFPNLVRNFSNKDIDFFINISDDSWFGKTGATYQHTQSLVFRSIENRLSSIRATNTGLSCFISPLGEIYGRVKGESGEELFISGYSTEEVTISNIDTFYKKYGDIFAYICLLILLVYIVLHLKRQKTQFN